MAAQQSALFGTGLSQHARLITLATAQDSDLPESLMAERFAGREAVNELFCFEVDALSVATDLALDQFLGEEITLKLLLADGTRRAWHGICTNAAWVGADGGVARYRLRVEPALHLLRERRDSYIFQDKNVREIATELLADYPQVRFEFEVGQELVPRAICTQYRESDFDFLLRILASEGLSWRFEHEQSDTSSTSQAKHKLVIFDSKAAVPDTPDEATLRFHGVRATDTHDAIDQFAAVRRIQPNAVTSSSWHPEQLLAPAAERTSSLDAGELPALPVHAAAASGGALFVGLAAWAFHGVWALALLLVFAVEIVLTLGDFVVEGRTRLLPATERVTHTVLAMNGGASITLLALTTPQWLAMPTALVWQPQGALRFSLRCAVSV